MSRLASALSTTDTIHHPTRNGGVVGNGICPGPGVLLRTVPWQELPHLGEHSEACRRLNLGSWSPHDYNRNSANPSND